MHPYRFPHSFSPINYLKLSLEVSAEMRKYILPVNINKMSAKRLSADSVFLGKYISKRKLGKGAFGDVFLVE